MVRTNFSKNSSIYFKAREESIDTILHLRMPLLNDQEKF